MPVGIIITNSVCDKCINVLILERKDGTENIKFLIDFLGGWESGAGKRTSHASLQYVEFSATQQNLADHRNPATLEYWLTQSEAPRVLWFLTSLTVMGRRLLSIPVWLPSGHPFFPGQDSSFALAAQLLFASSSHILPCCQIPFNLPDYDVGSFSWGWLQRYVHFWLFFCRRFLSQCNLFGGRMESLIIGYRYISQDNPQHPQLFLFCGAF